MKKIVMELEVLQHIFAPSAEYTGREVLDKLLKAGIPYEITKAPKESCTNCRYCSALEDGSLNCRNLLGLNGKVENSDGCSRGVF